MNSVFTLTLHRLFMCSIVSPTVAGTAWFLAAQLTQHLLVLAPLGLVFQLEMGPHFRPGEQHFFPALFAPTNRKNKCTGMSNSIQKLY
jgi:hypothetical protein